MDQEDFDSFDLEEIDDCNYYSKYNCTLKNDEINQPHTSTLPGTYQASSLYSDASSTAVLLSSDASSSEALLPCSNASSTVSLPVRQRLHGIIKQKMRAEGKQNILVLSPQEEVNQLTPEEEFKRVEKQQRNKEAARRSRQKKKESEEQLIMEHKHLTAKNEELTQDVACLKKKLFTCQQFLSAHQCVSSQQDNGDKICVKTSSNKVWGDDYETSSADDQYFQTAFELMNIYGPHQNIGQGSELERVNAIFSDLQGDEQSEMVTALTAYAPAPQDNRQSEMVTSGTAYATQKVTSSVGYNIGVQENMLLDSVCHAAKYEELKTGSGAVGGSMPREAVRHDTQIGNTENIGTYQLVHHVKSPVASLMTQTSSSSLMLMKQCKQNINPWSTEGESQNEADEAKKLVDGFSPPPEKKFRRE